MKRAKGLRRAASSTSFCTAAGLIRSVHQLELAREAYRRYGKGYHRAALNFGDCCAYALAAATGEPLLFKGADFIHTDIPSCLYRG